ncbi:acyl-CoA dehydrogenase family protein [Burkholderia contaminans]|nr:acyl-CoA dehydrogenase family protein [Burkholderia contaminans]
MTTYNAPSSEYRFLSGQVLAQEYARMPGSHEATPETFGQILDALGAFVSDRIVPLAASADAEGCKVVGDAVRTPAGYRETYEALIADGWGSLHAAEEHGGQNLPLTTALACDELLSSGAMAFSLYTSLRLGVYKVIQTLGTEYLKDNYLAKLGSGEWNGTMCLTEPQSGTDLSLLRTTATPADDGTFRLSGTKIFISGGDHDLTDNIVHLVLARVKGGSSGLGGLGLFIVPKLRADADGIWQVANGVCCPRVEDKLGIHASATAELLFDDAQGWIVGESGAGLAGMFIMMKLARLGTAFQAIGVAEIASQHAIAYASERIQGRDLVAGGRGSVAISEHPNVKREIVRMRTLTASARMLAFLAAIMHESSGSADEAIASHAETLVSVLMPLTKAICSEIGVEVATAAMQIYGGHGYIRDSGIERMLRDVQILPIYEGTNDIQALDIVLRRIGDGTNTLMQWLRRQVAELEPSAHMTGVCKTFDLIDTATYELGTALKTTPFASLQMAREYLWLLGHGVMGVLWLRALATLDTTEGLPVDPVAKRAEAAFYFAYVHPDAELRAARLAAAAQIQSALQAYPIQVN